MIVGFPKLEGGLVLVKGSRHGHSNRGRSKHGHSNRGRSNRGRSNRGRHGSRHY